LPFEFPGGEVHAQVDRIDQGGLDVLLEVIVDLGPVVLPVDVEG
jgi:hypothetical protein